MVHQAGLRGIVVLRARRDTIVLVAAATAITLALSSAIHSHPGALRGAAQTGWTGDLADVAPPPRPATPFTSASLVVPRAELALPQVAVRPLLKLRGCVAVSCAKPAAVASARRPSPAPMAPVRVVTRPASTVEITPVLAASKAEPAHTAQPTLMSRLNPLNHLPKLPPLTKPFTVAGDTVTGWFRR